MSVEKEVPEIRFKGFKDEWNTLTLGELGTVATNKRIFIHQTSLIGDVPFYKIGTFGREPKLFISQELFEDYKKRYPFPQKGDLLFSVIGSIGRVVEYTGEDEYFQDSNVVWLKHDGAIVNSFLKQFYSIVEWEGIEGSTIKHLYNRTILGTQIQMPSRKEQTKIGNIFQKLDGLINHHQQKHDKLSSIKKAMLEKMFPKQGETTPKIRFKGFSGEWEKDTVSALLNERNEQEPKSENYPLMAFVAGKGVAPKGDRYNRDFLVNDELNKKYKQTEMGDFIYSSNNLETGSIGLNNYGSASISPVYSIFQPTSLADSEFVGRLLIRKNFINQMVKWRQGVVYGQWRIHESDFLSIEVKFTSLGEQEKIGNFFKKLDTLINQHQQQVTKLNNIKQACLSKMFV